ncbi:MAG: hypothetical protein II776_03230 [Clostridia bacterium]|nr:hypothetical protein [Clostridia bacterium]
MFDPEKVGRIYIIKGGPGTGKSGLMRRISREAEKRDLSVEKILCSSDPSSLDGVLIPSLDLAVLDGTAPHTADPVYPGAVESIVNTGAFWDRKELLKRKEEILSLTGQGKRCYRRAYRFLEGAGAVAREMQRSASAALLKNKMEKQIDRLEKKFFSRYDDGENKVVVRSSFNKNGLHTLPVFETEAREIYAIKDRSYTGLIFLKELFDRAKEKKQSVDFAPSPIFPECPEALYFPLKKVLFTVSEPKEANAGAIVHTVNMRRFLDEDMLSAHRQKMRFGVRCFEMLLQGATDAFREAADLHDALEKYYVAAMDFEKLNEFAGCWIDQLFS